MDFILYSEKLFRPDGSLKIFNNKSQPPNPFDPNNPSTHVQCQGNTVGDFDGDGHADDQCYNTNSIAASPSGVSSPDGFLGVQGGKIDLTGFSVAVGVRFHF